MSLASITLDNLCAMVVARHHASGATPGAR